jgi:universal stress protein E
MRMLQSILLAVECRQADDAAVDAAVRLARTFGSQLTLLHVVEATHPAIQLYRMQDAGSFLEKLKLRLAELQVPVVRSVVKLGTPAQTIVEIAQEVNADLIVIGAGERRNPAVFTLGPIAETVIAHAPQPVLAIRPGDPEPSFSRILCPVDQSRTSLRGLQNAVRLAKAIGGELSVLSVVPEVSWLTAAAETGVLTNAKVEHASEWIQEFDQFIQRIDVSGVSWKSEVRFGVPHEQIAVAAEELGSDLIVMGATGRTGLVQVLLGSTTRRLLRVLPCSLLTVKQDDVLEELFEWDLAGISRMMTEAKLLSATESHRPAIRLYRQVLVRDPFHREAMHELTVLLEAIGETEEAARYRNRLARLETSG